MEQHDDVMRATCLTCGAAGPNCKEDADNPGNHYCARCWKKYWEAVGATLSAPSTQQDGIAAVPCDNDNNDEEEAEEATKVSDGASSYAAAAAQQTQSPTEIDPVCAWGGDTRSCDFCNRNLCEESCRNPIQNGQIKCNHDGCNAMVHLFCQFTWLGKANFEVDVKAPVTSPRHCNQYQEFVIRRRRQLQNN